MAAPSQSQAGGTYFVTSNTFGRRRLFQVTANAELFMQTLERYQTQGNFKLHAFVIMPDHVHLLLTTQGQTLERVMGLVKGGFSHSLHASYMVWQRGFIDHRIRGLVEFRAKREYIHQNPVRAHLVESPDLYPYSSATLSLQPDRARS